MSYMAVGRGGVGARRIVHGKDKSVVMKERLLVFDGDVPRFPSHYVDHSVRRTNHNYDSHHTLDMHSSCAER